MKKLSRKTANIDPPFPEKILQFGGGNFLRAFADWMIDIYNEKNRTDLGILVVKTTREGDYEAWSNQEGLYHVLTRGIQNGNLVDECHLVKCISHILHVYKSWEIFLNSAENENLRYLFSNTTEMGIRFSVDDKKTATPPREFPAKLTLWLYRRYRHFKGSNEKGCIFFPLELIPNNGEMLRICILQNADNWHLENGFKNWINKANIFCNTLVDRIVPGIKPDALKKEMKKTGFEDQMMTEGEAFHFWAIEAPVYVRRELPLDKIGLNVIYTDDLSPYRIRKLRILNGAHTLMVPVGYLYGFETVRETVEHDVSGKFVERALFDEIIMTMAFPENELLVYAKAVLERFKNPFINHHLTSIALNSVSKFRFRVLPSILAFYEKKGEVPVCLVFSMAALVHFYKGEYEGGKTPLNDSAEVIAHLQNLWKKCNRSDAAFTKLAEKILQWEAVWGRDLTSVSGFSSLLGYYLYKIEKDGMQKALRELA